MERWTIKQLNEISMEAFIVSILSERQSKLNRYSPLCQKLKQAQKAVEQSNIPGDS